MKKENLLQDSVNKRLDDERYRFPKEKKNRRRFNMQWILIISVLIGLGMSIAGLIRYFFN